LSVVLTRSRLSAHPAPKRPRRRANRPRRRANRPRRRAKAPAPPRRSARAAAPKRPRQSARAAAPPRPAPAPQLLSYGCALHLEALS